MEVGMLALMALLASTGAQTLTCDVAPTLLRQAQVVELPNDPVALGLIFDRPGLALRGQSGISWPKCKVRLQTRVYGGWAFTGSGVPVRPDTDHLITRDDTMYPDDPEPRHPELRGATFVSSTSLATSDYRLGVWTQPNGSSKLASYRPGQTAEPKVLLSSAKPILGVGYLPAPDSRGGLMSIWQELGDGKYRYIDISWDESGL